MIFTKPYLESYKERNLYYKFFAGYYFNELINNKNDLYKDRVTDFHNILTNGLNRLKKPVKNFKMRKLGSENIHVSFDNHEIQYTPKAEDRDRGEFADIFIADKTNNIFIAVEVKFLSNINYEKDVIDQQDRIKRIMEYFIEKSYIKDEPKPEIYQFLLLKEEKWKNMRGKSNYNKLVGHINIRIKAHQTDIECRLGVICWQDFLANIKGNEEVRNYLNFMLNNNDWTKNFEAE